MKFRLNENDIRWSGIDDTTPPGHCIAVGTDRWGKVRIWLFEGTEPSNEHYRGSITIPAPGESSLIYAYGPTGAYARSGFDQTYLLQHLADKATATA